MKKTVTRTYYNKSLGEFVTKTYEYEYSKAKTSPLLVDKNGRVYENRVKEFTKDMDVYDKAEVEQYIKFYSQHKKRVRMRIYLLFLFYLLRHFHELIEYYNLLHILYVYFFHL